MVQNEVFIFGGKTSGTEFSSLSYILNLESGAVRSRAELNKQDTTFTCLPI